MAYPTVTVEIAFDGDVGQTYEDAVLADDPVLYWRLGETVGSTAEDETANNLDGTYQNTPTLNQGGALSGDSDPAVLFNGTDEYVSRADDLLLDLGDSFTVELWIRADVIEDATLVDKGTDAYRVDLNADGTVSLAKSGGADWIKSDLSKHTALAINTYYHIVAAKDGATGALYINGVNVTPDGALPTLTFADSASALALAAVSGGASGHFDGRIDEFALYGGALSEERAKYHYSARQTKVSPTWTDVSTDVEELASVRGRQSELERTEPGKLNLPLDNSHGKYDTENTTSPYYPNVKPMRPVRVKIVVGGNTYNVYRGYVERWPVQWEGPDDSTVVVTAVDAMAVLARTIVPSGTAFPEELSGARIARILDHAGWPRALRSLATGQKLMAAVADAEGDALAQIQAVAEAEHGNVFTDGQGRVVFHDVHTRLQGTYLSSQLTLSDAPTGGELQYEPGVEASTDNDAVLNDVRYTPDGGTEERAYDADSDRQYGPVTTSKTLLLALQTDARALADYMLQRRKDPQLRFEDVTVALLESDTYWDSVLARELGDRITIERTPPRLGGTPAQFSKEVNIEKIELSLKPARDSVAKLRVSVADPNFYWILGDSTFGVLGVTTRLGP